MYVSHDEDDGMWQFLCGKTHETDEAKLVSLNNSVGILTDMPCGYYAESKTQDDDWIIKKTVTFSFVEELNEKNGEEGEYEKKSVDN